MCTGEAEFGPCLGLQCASWAALQNTFIYNWQLRSRKVKEECLRSHHAFTRNKYSWIEGTKKEEEELTKGEKEVG